MNKLFSLAGIVLVLSLIEVFMPSCTKTETKTITVTDTVTKTVTDTVKKIVTDSSVLHLLTEKQWISDSVYTNYTGPNTGTLVYVRGSSNNIQDYSTVRLMFWKDGTQDFFWNGAYNQYQWSFTGTDSANVLIKHPALDYARILKLSANSFTIYDSTGSGLAVYIYKP